MSAVLLFITGVLTGVIVGFILSKNYLLDGPDRSFAVSEGSSGSIGITELRLRQPAGNAPALSSLEGCWA